MPIPNAWAEIPLSGSFVQLDGSPVKGHIAFRMQQGVVIEGVYVPPLTFYAELDEDGSFAIDIPSSTDPDLNDVDWKYSVYERFEGGRPVYSITVPHDAGPLDLADLVPA